MSASQPPDRGRAAGRTRHSILLEEVAARGPGPHGPVRLQRRADSASRLPVPGSLGAPSSSVPGPRTPLFRKFLVSFGPSRARVRAQNPSQKTFKFFTLFWKSLYPRGALDFRAQKKFQNPARRVKKSQRNKNCHDLTSIYKPAISKYDL